MTPNIAHTLYTVPLRGGIYATPITLLYNVTYTSHRAAIVSRIRHFNQTEYDRFVNRRALGAGVAFRTLHGLCARFFVVVCDGCFLLV